MGKLIKRLFGLFGLLAVASMCLPASAATLTVTNLDDSGSGSLRQSISDSVVGDTIVFDQSLNGGTIALASPLVVIHGLTIDATSLPDGITLSGNNATQIMEVDPDNYVDITRLQGLDFVNGAGSAGGALMVGRANLVINQCSFLNNTSDFAGGAIFASGGVIAATNSTFANNESDRGAVYYGSPHLFLANSTVVGNRSLLAEVRSAVLVADSDVIYMRNTTVVGNSGGFATLQALPSVPYFENSMIVGNGVDLVNFGFQTPEIEGYGSGGYNLLGTIEANLAQHLMPSDQVGVNALDVFVDVDGNNLIDAADLQDLGGRTLVLEPLADGLAVDMGNPDFSPNDIETVLPGPFPGPPLLPEWVQTIVQSLAQGDQRGAGFPRNGGARVDIGAVEISGTIGTPVAVPVLNNVGLYLLLLLVFISASVYFHSRRVITVKH